MYPPNPGPSTTGLQVLEDELVSLLELVFTLGRQPALNRTELRARLDADAYLSGGTCS